MSSLLYDKADTRFTNEDLSKINDWATKHATECKFMEAIIKGNGTMLYGVEYCKALNSFDYVGICMCGRRYYVGEENEWE